MSWRCRQCGTENDNGRDTCGGCGRKRAAVRKFYINWVFGSAAFFFVVYMAGTFFGSTLIDVAVTPTGGEILSVANERGANVTSLSDLSPEARAAAKATAAERAKSHMSEGTAHMIYWFITIILIFFCGGIIGFVSLGRTIIEVGIGSALGQLAGYGVERFILGRDVGTTAIGVVVAIGILVALGGAWVGEVLQGKGEQTA
jgi:hypothetical protein